MGLCGEKAAEEGRKEGGNQVDIGGRGVLSSLGSMESAAKRIGKTAKSG